MKGILLNYKKSIYTKKPPDLGGFLAYILKNLEVIFHSKIPSSSVTEENLIGICYTII